MRAPPAPVVQPVSLMNQLSATASTNAASAVSAYSGPADAPSPIPRPEGAIHALPNTGPYQRKPMTIAAAVATMIATQFTCPPPTRLTCAHRLEQGHKHSDLARVLGICGAEALSKQPLFGHGAQVQGRI